ncbi:putative transcription factor C2H2 family [Arabidopsis thaliana]|uniref:At3g23140 n=4 Tax=Arabidopsis TaxID=3701 RepID=Q9LTD6_ARATH|nr:C2H2 and C2HC zinc fingers superfamily protein [Arabidopsis thaliana]KAG7626278.1 Zinc finger C2H2-type [Arabidopsis thaliana x Arabidopsis arenosa]KAG7632263.1 Zinc finger C2H2-type [Arabidopsis suecica]ACB88838.1 At3g23140 [Arabidopsis thaliana]AEE76722.1 C2H2 and C2HC zinc fingers superfamily protein [Arabidopsis thaliana]OAP01713.1 URO [Arabidopsis thaliana]|eukprot:NP_188955.1 C2H2 and C2HC zinc fingers superfamily protein [Arabidopsis thaliana]
MNHRDKQIDSGSGSGENRRTYDCDICKRGFTNPQALGGHNNIHRRERERYPSSSSSSHSFPFSLPLPSQSPSSSTNFTNPPPYFPTIESYLHQGSQPPINPSHNTQYFGSSSSSRGGGRFAQGASHDLNLSLGLGSMNEDDDTHRSPPETGGSQPQDGDLDLDLRLGGHRHH